jgi:hypothetical protein
MKALVDGTGRVAQVVANRETFKVHESLKWVDAPNGTTTRHRWTGSDFVLPGEPAVNIVTSTPERDAALAAAGIPI